MRSTKETTTPRRIKVGENHGKAAEIRAKLQDICYFGNTKIIPALELLELEITLENVLKYIREPQAIKEDYIKRELPAVKNPLLNDMMRERINQEFESLVSIPAKGELTPHQELLRLVEDEDRAGILELEEERTDNFKPMKLGFDVKELQEATTIYLTDPAELEAYDRHQEAVKAMNKFFIGKGPRYLGDNLFRYFVPDPENPGYLKAAELLSYKDFVKN